MSRSLLLLSVLLTACNGEQQECPDSAKILVYADEDRDGYGDDAIKRMVCEVGALDATVGGDCDDTRSNIFPGALEECDGLDNDCDGAIDEDLRLIRWYADDDGDGFGSSTKYIEACAPPPGYVDNDQDCYDDDALSHPTAQEFCDGKDNNCDGRIDDQDPDTNPATMTTWYADADGDGFGDPKDSTLACKIPFAGAVTNGDDCHDGNPNRHPNATEVCNGVDDDCDGHIDDSDADIDPSTFNTWYFDNDGDGYGDASETIEACDAPWFYVGVAGDCDDEDPLLGDESTGLWVVDADGDGFGELGGETVGPQCNAPAGHVIIGLATDCDDTNDQVNPDALEICDGLDNDCNGLVDGEDEGVDLSAAETYYVDGDEDGFGDPDNAILACAQPEGTTTDNTDCDDLRADVNPDAIEICNGGVDDDCNELADGDDPGLDLDSLLTWFEDLDEDGWGNPDVMMEACDQPAGFVENDLDCDDLDADGAIFLSWYEDLDGDGFGAGAAVGPSCEPPDPEGWVTELQPLDCDDTNSAINPIAEDICEDGVDQDCDGVDPACALPIADTCAEAQAYDPLTTGSHFVEADLTGFASDVTYSTANVCTGRPTAGGDGFLPVVLEPGEVLYASYDQAFDGSLYILPDCATPSANNCLLGADNLTSDGGIEHLWYANDTGSRLTFYLVADCAGADCGEFSLDVQIEPRPAMWLPDTCGEATGFDPLVTGGYSIIGSNAGNVDDLSGITCTGWASNGDDTIVPLELLPGESVWVRYQQILDDASVYLVTDCTSGGSCVEGSDSTTTGGLETFTYTNTSGTTELYYLVADCWTYPYPGYDLCRDFRLGVGIE